MKKLFLLLVFLCALCGNASATDVTISAQTLSALPFNPTDVGSDQTFAVTVTSGSPTVTTATPIFPTNIVGKSGFQVSIGGVQYVVASVASRSSLTLTANYGGLTGSANLTLYKFVFLRVYANRAFQPLGSNEVVQPGGPGTGQFYKEVAVSIINSGSGNVAWIPQFVLPATTDALISNQARYSFVFFRAGGSQLGTYDCGVGRTELQLPPNSPATFAFICNYNSAGGIAPNGQEAYPKTYINEIHPNCTAGQMDYYSITGQKKSCLTLGTGLEISGGTLSVTGGGGGGGGIGGSGTLNYVPYFTPNGTTIASTNLIYSTASQLFQFGYSVDIQAGGLSKLTLETDQVIFQGGVSRANNSIMQAMKATASQTGPFQRFTDSTGSIKFEVDVDGDVKPRGVNYTWPLTSTTGAMLNTSGTLSWVPFNSSYFSTSGSITPKGLAGAINPKTDHGCVGDDVADDTTCLANAITAAVASGGKAIKLDAGTYKTTAKLTVPGGVTIIGDGKDKTIIHGTANDVIVDAVVGSGLSAFNGPVIQHIGIRGSSSGANQIGLRVDDATYFAHVNIQDVAITATGSHGMYIGKAFSSTFKRITSGNSLAGYPFLVDTINMPANHFEELYPGDVNTTSPAGFRIRSGTFNCISCNGINVSGSNSWWAIVGDKVGVDGAVSNRSAYIDCHNCNIESSKAGGVLFYYNSTGNFTGRTEFTGDGGSAGTYIALKFEIDTTGGLIPAIFPKGHIGPLVVFTSSPLSYYANSEPIHANDLPPITIAGDVRQADGNIITSYRNTTNSRSENLYRLDARKPVVTITSSATFTQPGATNYEINCSSPCTLSLPWPGFWASNEQLIYIRNIGTAAGTINANSGGSMNGGGSYVLNSTGESVVLLPHSASADYRLVGLGGAGAANRIPFFDSVQHLTSSANLTYDGTTVLNQRAGGNPYFAANDTTNGITTRFGPLAGAPDRAIIGTTSNHPFGLYANNAERWTVGTTGHLTPGASNSYDFGSAGLPVRTGYFGTALNLGIGSSTTGQIVLNNSSNANTTTLQSGAPASSIAITLPATLPASAGCLQISSSGVISQTGSACGSGGGGSAAWSDLTAPMASLSLAMAAYPTTFTWNATTGSSVNLFNLTDTASNTGTGYVLTVGTAASSAAKPIRITAGGTANGVEMTTAGALQAIGSGGIIATTGDSATAFFSAGQIEAARGGTGIDTSASTGVPRISGGTWSANAGISHLASSTSADLRGTLSDETGTGAAVFAGGNIGAATATSLNGLTITNSTGTFTLANGKTFTVNNSLALSGTDGTTMTFPATSTTLAGLSIAQTFTALQTINPGTTPADGLLFEIGTLGGTGQRDSHNLVFRGRSNNGSGHLAEWKQFVDITSNAGASQLIIGSSLDGGSFTNWLTIADSGDVSLGNIIGSSATFGGAVAADTLSAATSLAVTGTSTMREIDPQTDNTYDLGTTSLRWKTLHVGPGSVVIHNDATNTLKATLGFSGSTAQLVTDSATPLKIAVGAGNGIQFATGGGVSVNGLTLSGSSSTFSVGASKTAAINNSLTFTGTDSTSFAFPSVSTTVAGLGTTQTFTATQTFTGGVTLGTPGAIAGSLVFANATNSNLVTITSLSTANVALSLPATSSDTIVARNTTDTLTNKTISGASNTITNLSAASIASGTIAAAQGGTGLDTSGATGIPLITVGTWSVISTTGTGNAVRATSPTIVTPTIAKLANLTANGFVKTSGGDGTLNVDTSTYLTANQTITLSGDVTGSGTTAITTTVANVPDSALSANVPLLDGANTFAAGQTISQDDAVTNTFSTLLDLRHSSTSTPTTSFGASIRFGLETTTTANRDAGRINTQWTTATDASRTSSMTWQLVNSGTLATKATLAGNGDFTITGAYAGTTFNGIALSGSSSTLNVGTAKTVTISNSLTLAGTDSTTITFQGTDTYVGRATTDTLTNKALTASSNVLGGVTMTLGSDATGDTYYRNSGGVLTRLGIGSTSAELMTVSGLPSWKRQIFHIIAYGAVCDGSTTNDRAAIQAAIDAAGAAGGGVVSFAGCTAGTRIDTGLTIGDGSGTYSTGSATASTYNDVEIDGANTKLRWYGSAGGTVFTINGPIYRLKIRDLFINMKPSTNSAGIALDINHSLLSEYSNIYIYENSDYGVRLRAYGGWTGGDGANGNIFDGVTVNSTTAGAKGLDLGYTAVCSGCALDPAQNIFRNFRARFDNGSPFVTGSIGINLNFTDASQFDNPIIGAATALKVTVPTGTGGDGYPAGILFNNPALTGTASFTVSGTWNAVEGIGFNNYLVGDAQTLPEHAKVYGVTSNGVRFNQKGDAGHIAGLQLEWVSTTQVKIKTGSAQIQSTGEIVTLSTDSTISPTLSASAWHYCYLYLSSGTPTVECVTTAPDTPWIGNARSKASATGRRYIGAIRTNGSSQIYEFYHNSITGYYQWGEVTTSSPFRVCGASPACQSTTEAPVSVASVVPATSRLAQLRMINTEAVGGQNSFIRSRTGGPNELQLRVNSDLITPIALTSSQGLYYIYSATPTGSTFIDVIGFYDLR